MNTKKLDMMMSILKFGLVALGVILCFALFFTDVNMESTIEEQEKFREGTSLMLATSFTGFILFAGMGIVVLFFIVQLISNTKKTLMSIIGILGALVLYLVISMVGTSDTNESLQLIDPVEAKTIASTTAGLYTVIIGLVIAVVVVVLGPFMGRYRK